MNLNTKLLTFIIIALMLFALGALGVGVFSISRAPQAVPLAAEDISAALQAKSALAQAQALAHQNELELAQARNDSIRVQGQADVDRTRADIDLSKANTLLSIENARGFLTGALAIGGSVVVVVGMVMLLTPQLMKSSAEAEERKVRAQLILENFAVLPPEVQASLVLSPGRRLPQLSQVTGQPIAGRLLANPIPEKRTPAVSSSMAHNADAEWSRFYDDLDRQYGAE